MHVTGKKMAFSGLALALTVMAIILSGILEFNTLFLLGLASFFVGIVIRECGMGFGAAFYVAAILLGFLLAPQKFYCITFGSMGLYVLGVELAWRMLIKRNPSRRPKTSFWICKYLIFNIMYLPMLFAFPYLLFARGLSTELLILAVVLGQVILFVYDRAYEYFQAHVWTDWRKRLKLNQP